MRVEPVEGRLADQVLPGGDDGQGSAGISRGSQSFRCPGDGLDAVGEVAGVEEGVDDLVGGVAGAAPDLEIVSVEFLFSFSVSFSSGFSLLSTRYPSLQSLLTLANS